MQHGSESSLPKLTEGVVIRSKYSFSLACHNYAYTRHISSRSPGEQNMLHRRSPPPPPIAE